MRKILTLATMAIIMMAFIWGSFVSDQLPPSEEPLDLVEAGTGSPIQDLLIVPTHTASVGISTFFGHGPGRMSHEDSLTAPFVYRHGDPFRLRRPRSIGLAVWPGLLFVGRGNTLKGIVAVSRSHRALWVWSLWNRSLGAPFEMQPLSEQLAYRKWLLALLDGDVIRGNDLSEEDRRSFSLISSSQILVKFSAEDRKVVREYLNLSSGGPPNRPLQPTSSARK